MPKTMRAVFENGVLRPLEPLELAENQIVSFAITDGLTLEPWLDDEYLADCTTGFNAADGEVDLADVRAALAKLPGSLTEDFIRERDDR